MFSYERLCKDVFINNINPTLLEADNVNVDFKAVTDPYSIGEYCCGYILKVETGQNKLLQ